jgi:uncharacterized protein YndB with AHSA1/START domain
MKDPTTVERRSERELVVTRIVHGPPRVVFEAWTRPELLKRWWVPKSCGLTLASYEADVRVGGAYKLVFKLHGNGTMAFFGTYLEVTPHSRLSWTNDEGEGQVITTVTFEASGGATLLTVHDRYPSKQALDDAIASGATSGLEESLTQLDELLATSRAAD